MHNFKIDDEIVKAYINKEPLDQYHSDKLFLFSNGIEKEHESMFTIPKEDLSREVTSLYKEVIDKLSNFCFSNEKRFEKFLGDTSEMEDKIIIKLVVGFPNNVKKLFKSSDDDKIHIIFDLYNYVSSMRDASIDDMMEDIYDYLGYAICLLILDSRGSTEEEGQLAILNHAIFSASYAYYISCSEHLDYMREANVYEIWLYLEYDTLKRISHSKRKKNQIADNYLGVVFQTNPEMIIIGVSGKTYLENMNEDDAYKLFLEGSTKFVNCVEKSSHLERSNALSFVYMVLNALLPLTVIGFIIWGIITTIKGEYTLSFKIAPLIIALLEGVRELIRYKLKYSNILKLIIYLACIIIVTILYTLFVVL